MSIADQFKAFVHDIRLLHVLYSLPFLGASVLIIPPSSQGLTWQTALLLVAALFTARTYALGINRIADHRLDALNPRTQHRAIPSGALSVRTALIYTGLNAVAFLIIVSLISSSSSYSSPSFPFSPFPLLGWALLVLFFLGAYSWIKRIHWLVHFYCGLTLGALPLAVSIALHHTVVGAPPYILCALITFWVAGFDMLYAIADTTFDHHHNLKSIPRRFGKTTTRYVAGTCFAIAAITMTILGPLINASSFYYMAAGMIAAILLWQIARFQEHKASTILHINAWVGVLFGLTFALNHLIVHG